MLGGSYSSGQCSNGSLLSCMAHPVEQHQVACLALIVTPCRAKKYPSSTLRMQVYNDFMSALFLPYHISHNFVWEASFVGHFLHRTSPIGWHKLGVHYKLTPVHTRGKNFLQKLVM